MIAFLCLLMNTEVENLVQRCLSKSHGAISAKVLETDQVKF